MIMITLIKAEFLAGTDINSACEISLNIAERHNCNVLFDFNGVSILVTPNYNANDLVKDYYFMIKKKEIQNEKIQF